MDFKGLKNISHQYTYKSHQKNLKDIFKVTLQPKHNDDNCVFNLPH